MCARHVQFHNSDLELFWTPECASRVLSTFRYCAALYGGRVVSGNDYLGALTTDRREVRGGMVGEGGGVNA